jgi:hypothetical protein
MPLNIWNGSSWKPFKKIKIHDGITWNDAKRIFIYDGNAWKPVTEVTPINTVLPVISPQLDNYLWGAQETMSVSNGTWDNSPTSYKYQWQKSPFSFSGYNWSDIEGQTTASLFLNENEWDSSRSLKYVGYAIRCKVTATNSYGDNKTPIYTLPSSPVVPQKLTTLTATVVENGVIKLDWVKPVGANNFYLQYQGLPDTPFTEVASLGDINTYTFDTGNAGGSIGIYMSPKNTSNASGMELTGLGKNSSVMDLKPNKPTVTTTMTGESITGATLNWSLNLIQPTSWIIYNNGVSYAGSFMNGGANATSYTIQEFGSGGTSFGSFTITINGTAPRFNETSWSSTPGLTINYPAAPKPVNTVAPTVSTTNGRTFAATTGTWTNSGSIYSYIYEWFADGSPIDNVFIYESDTINLYDTTAYDNKAITCTVQCLLTDLTMTTAAASSNSAQSLPKAPTVIAPTWAGGSPVVSGSERGWSVSSVGTWNNTPTSYSYQWEYFNVPGYYWSNAGTGSSITTPSGNDGKAYRCIVTASNSAGSATATSNTVYPSAPAPVGSWGACTQYNNGTDYGYDCSGTVKMTWSRPIYGYRERYYLDGVATSTYRDCTGSPTYGDKVYQGTSYWTWQSADCGYVAPIAIEYYVGYSWCNANSGAYISAPSADGPYTASSMPTDVLTGSSNSREKIVYRSTYAAALAAVAQAACAVVAFTPPHFPPFFPPFFPPHFPPFFPPFFPPHFPPFFPPYFGGYPGFAGDTFTPPHFPPFFPPHFPPFFPPYFGGGGGGGCIAASTLISTPSGLVPAEEILVGDIVHSVRFNELSTDETAYTLDAWTSETMTPVEMLNTVVTSARAIKTVSSLININGDKYSEEHHILVDDGSVKRFAVAGDVQIGWKVLKRTGESIENLSWVDVTQKEEIQENATVYLFDTEEQDVLFTENMLTHNIKSSVVL